MLVLELTITSVQRLKSRPVVVYAQKGTRGTAIAAKKTYRSDSLKTKQATDQLTSKLKLAYGSAAVILCNLSIVVDPATAGDFVSVN